MGLFGGSKHKAPTQNDFQNIIDGNTNIMYRVVFDKTSGYMDFLEAKIDSVSKSGNKYKIKYTWTYDGSKKVHGDFEILESSTFKSLLTNSSRDGSLTIDIDEFEAINVGWNSRVWYVADKSLFQELKVWGKKQKLQITDFIQ